jgi:hypothetical protein
MGRLFAVIIPPQLIIDAARTADRKNFRGCQKHARDQKANGDVIGSVRPHHLLNLARYVDSGSTECHDRTPLPAAILIEVLRVSSVLLLLFRLGE